MRLIALPLCLFTSLVAPLAAGQTTTLSVTHNDPDGLVVPGETVKVTATFAWIITSGFGWIQGDVRATGDLGTAANPTFPYGYLPLPTTVVQPGTPSGGSILDIDIRSGDVSPWFLGTPPRPPWGLQTGLILTQFDWTAPVTPGVVRFDWVPDPTQPLPIVLRYFTGSSLAIPTTYVGTSLTVVPAPASALSLALGLTALSVRRRR